MNKTMLPAPDANPLTEALQNYNIMTHQLERATERTRTLEIENRALTAEVGTLREMLQISDADRVRLQHVSSTLMGQLCAINAVIADAVKTAVKHGVDAVEAHHEAAEAARELAEQVPAQAPAAPPTPLQPLGDTREAFSHPGVPAAVIGTPIPPPVFRDIPRNGERRVIR